MHKNTKINHTTNDLTNGMHATIETTHRLLCWIEQYAGSIVSHNWGSS